MIESSESKEVKQDYLEILDAILKKIKASGQSQGFEPSNDVSIFVGRELVYKGNIGHESTKNKLTPDSIEVIRKAISEPQNLKGSVRIMIGSENVFHAKDGKVINDRLGLNQSQNQAFVKQNPVASINSLEDLQKQIDTLQQKFQKLQKLIDTLKSQHRKSENISNISTEIANLRQAFNQQQKTINQLTQSLENVVKSASPSAKNSQFQDWIGAVESKLKQTALTLYNQAKTALSPKVDKLRLQIESQIQDLKSEVNQQINRFEKEVRTQVDDLRSQIQTGVQNENVRDALGQSLEKSPINPSINGGVSRQSKEGLSHFPSHSRKGVDQKIESTKTSVSTAAQQHAGQAQTVHAEVTKMAQDTHSKAVNTVLEGVQTIRESFMEAKVKAIEASVGAMLQLFGDRKADGSVSFESQNYHFHLQSNTISIKSKDGRDVLVDGALTSSVSEQDIKTLSKVQPMLNEHLSNNTAKSESQSSRIRR